MTKMHKYLKKGEIYPLDRMFYMAKAHVGKCGYCSCPVLFAPVIEIMVNNFKVIAFKVIDSKEEAHHCFKYKIEQVEEELKKGKVIKNF